MESSIDVIKYEKYGKKPSIPISTKLEQRRTAIKRPHEDFFSFPLMCQNLRVNEAKGAEA